MTWSDAARRAALEARLAHASGRTLYHVTMTKNAPSIMANGLLTKQPSNWVKAGSGARYGHGEVFAFESKADAVKWAGKMDWDKNKGMGTGKVAIAVFKAPTKGWTKDTADPLSQSGRSGNWLKTKNAVPATSVRAIVPVSSGMIRNLVRKQNARWGK